MITLSIQILTFHFNRKKGRTMNFIQVLVDNENRINAIAAGMATEEITVFCEKYHCMIAFYDPETETIKG
jgi:hypothetical protein